MTNCVSFRIEIGKGDCDTGEAQQTVFAALKSIGFRLLDLRGPLLYEADGEVEVDSVSEAEAIVRDALSQALPGGVQYAMACTFFAPGRWVPAPIH